MSSSTPTPRPSRAVLFGLPVVIAAIVGTLGYQSVSSSATSLGDVLRGDRPSATGEAGGAVRGSADPDAEIPAVAKLDPGLLEALHRAAIDAAADGVELRVNSGWRSRAYQQELLDEAISEYGSHEEASRWVASPETSAHVSGDAVDVGPSEAASWLVEHGAAYGLCQIYLNEPWHYELRPSAIQNGCPSMYADAAHDPRLQP